MSPYLLFTATIVSLLLLLHAAKPDLAADRAALLALRSAIGGRTLLWNVSEPSPCSWQGVQCQSGRVTELRLPGMGLSRQIPPGTIGNLTGLQTLSLRFNSLSGPLPTDIAAASDLRYIFLQENLFSGPIPDFLFSLRSLVRVNLASNNFSGEISPSFNNLTSLATLYLDNNKLTGSLPELILPSLVQFNVSNNQLNGSIPSSLAHRPANEFAGNSLCGGLLKPCNGTTPSSGSKKKLSGGAIAGIVIGSFLIVAILIFFLCRRKNSKKVDSKEGAGILAGIEIRREKSAGDAESLAPAPEKKADTDLGASKSLVFFRKFDREFDLEDLLKASAEVLGRGTFGTAYKAALEIGMVVAVKRLKDVAVAEEEFREKMELIGGMNHENLVLLRAYYYSRDEKLLVYDYMPIGSLSALLHGNRGAGRTPLNWETRSAIAQGAARGIAYLHSQGATISHGNIKSSNVLLTKSYEARVSDFGLSQLVAPTSTPNGYQAPEVTDTRKVTQKADVYSFGVLLLELLTGKAPTQALLDEEGVDLPRWVQSVVREEWTAEVFDLELLRYQNVEDEMVQLLQLAVDCVAQHPDKRPSMAEVTGRIEELCFSSLQQQHDPLGDTISDSDYHHRVDSGPPHASFSAAD